MAPRESGRALHHNGLRVAGEPDLVERPAMLNPAPHLPQRAIPTRKLRTAGVGLRPAGSARSCRILAVSAGVMIRSQSPGPDMSRLVASVRVSGEYARCPEIRAKREAAHRVRIPDPGRTVAGALRRIPVVFKHQVMERMG